jgi:hypothetical protein
MDEYLMSRQQSLFGCRDDWLCAPLQV